jgi:hypothetical protein
VIIDFRRTIQKVLCLSPPRAAAVLACQQVGTVNRAAGTVDRGYSRLCQQVGTVGGLPREDAAAARQFYISRSGARIKLNLWIIWVLFLDAPYSWVDNRISP